MRAVKSKDTVPEQRLQAALEGAGLEFTRGSKLPGRPDFLVTTRVAGGLEMAVFVHGCFWHCCPRHFRPVDKGRHDGWRQKFKRNVARDARVRRRLRRLGYRTMVVWEHDLKTDDMARRAAARVARRAGRST